MNIKTLYFIFEKYLEKIHPNNASDIEENEEDIATDLTNDYDYLCECARSLILQINTKINELRNSIIAYNKESPVVQLLGNTFTDKSTGEIKYKEHIIIKFDDSRTSLTSSEEVMYREEINGKYVKKLVQTNLLGKQQSGKNQYGLKYELLKDY
jgi:hypothetical protein